MTLCVELMIVVALVAWASGGLVVWRVMLRTTVADATEVSVDLMREMEATAAALNIFVGHIKGGQYWTPRMQKVYAAWKKEMNHDEDAPSNETQTSPL